MQIDNTAGSLDGEAHRHLQTLNRRRATVLLPLLIALVIASLIGRGGERTWVTSSIVRVPDPTQSSVFSTGEGDSSSRDAERIIASTIQLIKGQEVEKLVKARLSEERFDDITLFEVSSLEDTLFVNIMVGSLEPDVALEASRAFAEVYVAEQGRLDVADLEARATQLRGSADAIDDDLQRIDADLRQIEREIVIRDFDIRALESQLASGRVPPTLIEKTIERNDFDRDKAVQLSERGRKSQEQSFLRQEASNLDIEASYRRQTGAQIVAPPEAPVVLQERSLVRDLIVFGLFGLLIGMAIALMTEYFDVRVKSMQDLHDLAPDVPIVGAIPKVGNLVNQPHLAVTTGHPWYAAEAYRALRTTLLAVHGGQRNGFVISSVGAGSGKSVTVTNLAVSLAQSNFRVLVIDANLRRPSVHMKLGVENEVGVGRLLAERIDPAHLVRPSELAEGLHVLPAGPVPDNPAELLSSPSMAHLLQWGVERYDWVLVDSPPLDVFTDASVLAYQMGGVFLVVRFEGTDRRRLGEVLDQLETGGVPVLGFIVNGRDPAHTRAQRYARGVGLRNLRTLWTDRPVPGASSARSHDGAGKDQLDQWPPEAGDRPMAIHLDDPTPQQPVDVGARSDSLDP